MTTICPVELAPTRAGCRRDLCTSSTKQSISFGQLHCKAIVSQQSSLFFLFSLILLSSTSLHKQRCNSPLNAKTLTDESMTTIGPVELAPTRAGCGRDSCTSPTNTIKLIRSVSINSLATIHTLLSLLARAFSSTSSPSKVATLPSTPKHLQRSQ